MRGSGGPTHNMECQLTPHNLHNLIAFTAYRGGLVESQASQISARDKTREYKQHQARGLKTVDSCNCKIHDTRRFNVLLIN